MTRDTTDDALDTSTPDSPSGRTLDTSLLVESDSGHRSIPSFETGDPGVPTPASLHTEIPEADGHHVHVILGGHQYERRLRLLRGGVDPDRIIVLEFDWPGRSDDRLQHDIPTELRNESSLPVAVRTLKLSSDVVSLYVTAYQFVENCFQNGADDQLHLSIDLTAESTLITLGFFVSISAFVLEQPERRSSIDLYYVAENDLDVRSLIEPFLQSELKSESPRRDSPTPRTAAIQYIQRDLMRRYSRVQDRWEELRSTTASTTDVHDEVSQALDDIEATIDTFPSQFGPPAVHSLEDAVWLLLDCIEELNTTMDGGSDTDPEFIHPEFKTEVQRFEEAVSTLRTVVRENRRAFSQEESTSTAAMDRSALDTVVTALTEPDFVTTFESVDDSGVYRVPLPPAPQSLGTRSDDLQIELLRLVAQDGPFDSVSELARDLAGRVDETYDDSFRSKVQYNARTLAERGYIDREEAGRGYRITLSPMGRVWIQTHHR